MWEQFGETRHCSANPTLPWQLYLDRQFSQNFKFDCLNWKNFNFISRTLTFLYHLCILTSHFITFWPILLVSEIQDGRHFEIILRQETSPRRVANLKGNNFERSI